jgi:hypothetical protein
MERPRKGKERISPRQVQARQDVYQEDTEHYEEQLNDVILALRMLTQVINGERLPQSIREPVYEAIHDALIDRREGLRNTIRVVERQREEEEKKKVDEGSTRGEGEGET